MTVQAIAAVTVDCRQRALGDRVPERSAGRSTAVTRKAGQATLVTKANRQAIVPSCRLKSLR
jgi:hypothetical protein